MPLAKRATTVAELGFVPAPERPAGAAAPAATNVVPLYGRNIVRVTRSTDTTGYRIAQ